MSEFRNSTRRTVSGVAALAAAVSFASGCSFGESSKPAPSQVPTEAPASTLTPKPSPVDQAALLEKYLASPARNQRIAAAVKGFGEQVVAASEANDTPWGYFDAYCAQPNGPAGADQYLSKGYVPKPGDTCNIGHSPVYGGAANPNIQIGTAVVVGPDGKYTDTFTDGDVSSGLCYQMDARQDGIDNTWVTSIPKVPTSDSDYWAFSNEVKTAAQAEQIDNTVVSCLESVSYK